MHCVQVESSEDEDSRHVTHSEEKLVFLGQGHWSHERSEQTTLFWSGKFVVFFGYKVLKAHERKF